MNGPLTLDTINRIAAVVLDAQRIDPLSRDIARHYDDAHGFLEVGRVQTEKGNLFAACACFAWADEHRMIARTLRRRRWS